MRGEEDCGDMRQGWFVGRMSECLNKRTRGQAGAEDVKKSEGQD